MERAFREHKKVLGLHHRVEQVSKMEDRLTNRYPNILFYGATTIGEGLQMLLSLTFDLVIFEMNGKKTAELIDLASSREIPVIVLSENGHAPGSENVLCTADLEGLTPAMEKALRGRHVSLWPFMEKIYTFFEQAVCKLTPKETSRRYRKQNGSFIAY